MEDVFEEYKIKDDVWEFYPPEKSGRQRIYKFPNNYGASVITDTCVLHSYPYHFEIAILKFLPNHPDPYCYKLTSDTPITDDSIYVAMNEMEVRDVLYEIKDLKHVQYKELKIKWEKI